MCSQHIGISLYTRTKMPSTKKFHMKWLLSLSYNFCNSKIFSHMLSVNYLYYLEESLWVIVATRVISANWIQMHNRTVRFVKNEFEISYCFGINYLLVFRFSFNISFTKFINLFRSFAKFQMRVQNTAILIIKYNICVHSFFIFLHIMACTQSNFESSYT